MITVKYYFNFNLILRLFQKDLKFLLRAVRFKFIIKFIIITTTIIAIAIAAIVIKALIFIFVLISIFRIPSIILR